MSRRDAINNLRGQVRSAPTVPGPTDHAAALRKALMECDTPETGQAARLHAPAVLDDLERVKGERGVLAAELTEVIAACDGASAKLEQCGFANIGELLKQHVETVSRAEAAERERDALRVALEPFAILRELHRAEIDAGAPLDSINVMIAAGRLCDASSALAAIGGKG